jgi:tungstate transport system substrate-binding protein
VAVLFASACAADRTSDLRLGATTTIEDSGLLAVIDSAFEAAHPQYSVRAITGGTGEVLAIARRGDLDITWTHDPIEEAAYVEAGHGVERVEVMYNDFLIAGPPNDPAGITGQRDAAAALAAVLGSGQRFVSRGDESGTHRKEQQLWRANGVDPDTLARNPMYVVSGVGMGEALRVASELNAYILTDRATLARMAPMLRLTVLAEGDPRLVNRYAVIVRQATPRRDAADAFVDFLKGEGAAIIAEFGRQETGMPLFHPGPAPAN